MRNGTLLGFALALSVLLGNALVAYVSLHTLKENEGRVSQTRTIMREIQATVASLRDAEISQRDYLLTGEAAHLKSYNAAKARVVEQLAELRRLWQDSRTQLPRLDGLDALVARAFGRLDRIIELRRGQGFEAAVAALRAPAADGSAIDRLFADLEDEEGRVLAERSRVTQAGLARALVAIAVATALGAIAVALVYQLERRDIHERQRAAEELREQRERFRTILASIGDGVIVTDTEGRVTFLNPVAQTLTGWGDDAVGRPLDEVFVTLNERTRERAASPVGLALSGSSVMGPTDQTTLVARDGTEHPIDDTIAPVRDRRSQLQGAVLVFRDAAERRRASEALRASEDRFRALVEHASDAILLLSPDGTCVYASPTCQRVLGRPPEALIGRPALADVHPDDLADAQSGLDEVLRSPGTANTRQIRLRHGDGTWHWFEGTASNLLEHPSVRAIVVNFHDVTERRRANERLREQATLLDQATDAILVQDLENRIRYWNEGAERLYGWTAEEAQGRDAHQLLYRGASPERGEALAAMRTKGEWSGELRQVARDGQELVVESRWTLLRDEDGRPRSWLVINSDVTERKRLEAQLLRAQRLESLGTLAGGIAHDLNNVLTPILMGLDMLRPPQPDEQRQPILDTLAAAAQRGAEMVKQVLLFARGGEEAGRLPLPVKPILKEVERMLRHTLPKSIVVRTELDERLWPAVIDSTQFTQVLMNLCVNARDAMPQGGTLTLKADNVVLDEAYARMHLDARPGRYVAVTVADTGTGIPPEILDRIFEPFFTTKPQGQGTGLGLSTVRGIVQGHGGFLNVYSEVGRGSRFVAYFPAAKTSDPPRPRTAPARPTGHGELILVADDEVAIGMIVRQTLEMNGYRVLTAKDGAEAVELFQKHRAEVRVVVTDMMMPVLDGPATIRALRSLDPAVKIVAASGLSEGTTGPVQAEVKADAFLAKPFTPAGLLDVIRSVLAGAPSSDGEGERGA